MKILGNPFMGLLRNEAGEHGEGGGGEAVLDPTDHGYVTPEETPVEEAPLETAPQATDDMISLSQLERLEGMRTQQQQPIQQVAPQMTQEEINQHLNIFTPTLETAKQFFGDEATEAQVASLQGFADGIIKQMTTSMDLSSRMQLEDMNTRYSPALDMVAETKAANFTAGLEAQYPALSGQTQAIRQTVEHLKAQGFAPNSHEEAVQMVAGHTEALIKTVNPQFSLLTQPAAKQPAAAQGMPTMANLGAGGGGGSAGSSTKKNNKPAWDTIWG